MTLTLHDLAEFKRRERDAPGMTEPPANFLEDLKEYLARVKEEAGPHPAAWDMDCEAMAAIEILKEIFDVRRAKLARSAEHCAPPTQRQMFDFESCAWFGLTEKYQLLDKVIDRVCIDGIWSGKWGE